MLQLSMEHHEWVSINASYSLAWSTTSGSVSIIHHGTESLYIKSILTYFFLSSSTELKQKAAASLTFLVFISFTSPWQSNLIRKLWPAIISTFREGFIWNIDFLYNISRNDCDQRSDCAWLSLILAVITLMWWNDNLVDSILGLEPGILGSLPSSGDNFVFCNTLVGFRDQY